MGKSLVSEGGGKAAVLADYSGPEDACMDALNWKIIPLKTG
jgi:hypothetical protein